MNGLIGDRFLKRFFGTRLHGIGSELAGQVPNLPEETVPEDMAEEPADPGCPSNGEPLESETAPENRDPGDSGIERR